MAFREVETHEFDTEGRFNNQSISVGLERHGDFMLVFDGPVRLETTISFNRVIIEERTIEFESVTAECRHVKTGSLEGQPEDFGAVGAFLEQIAADPVGVMARV